MEKIELNIHAKHPGTFNNTNFIKISAKVNGLNPELKYQIENSEELKKIINRFYYQPGNLATENKKPFYIKITAIKKDNRIKQEITSNIKENFSDPIEKIPVEELIGPQGILPVWINQILTNNKFTNLNLLIPVPEQLTVYKAKNSKIIKEKLKFRDKIITSMYLGTLNISTDNGFLSFETSIFLSEKLNIISTVIKGFDKSFNKVGPKQLIIDLLNYYEESSNIIENSPQEIKESLNAEIVEMSFDQEKDLSITTKLLNQSLTNIFNDQNFPEILKQEIKENKFLSMFLTILPVLVALNNKLKAEI